MTNHTVVPVAVAALAISNHDDSALTLLTALPLLLAGSIWYIRRKRRQRMPRVVVKEVVKEVVREVEKEVEKEVIKTEIQVVEVQVEVPGPETIKYVEREVERVVEKPIEVIREVTPAGWGPLDSTAAAAAEHECKRLQSALETTQAQLKEALAAQAAEGTRKVTMTTTTEFYVRGVPQLAPDRVLADQPTERPPPGSPRPQMEDPAVEASIDATKHCGQSSSASSGGLNGMVPVAAPSKPVETQTDRLPVAPPATAAGTQTEAWARPEASMEAETQTDSLFDAPPSVPAETQTDSLFGMPPSVPAETQTDHLPAPPTSKSAKSAKTQTDSLAAPRPAEPATTETDVSVPTQVMAVSTSTQTELLVQDTALAPKTMPPVSTVRFQAGAAAGQAGPIGGPSLLPEAPARSMPHALQPEQRGTDGADLEGVCVPMPPSWPRTTEPSSRARLILSRGQRGSGYAPGIPFPYTTEAARPMAGAEQQKLGNLIAGKPIVAPSLPPSTAPPRTSLANEPPKSHRGGLHPSSLRERSGDFLEGYLEARLPALPEVKRPSTVEVDVVGAYCSGRPLQRNPPGGAGSSSKARAPRESAMSGASAARLHRHALGSLETTSDEVRLALASRDQQLVRRRLEEP